MNGTHAFADFVTDLLLSVAFPTSLNDFPFSGIKPGVDMLRKNDLPGNQVFDGSAVI